MSVPWHGANKGRVLYGVHQIWAGLCAILAWPSTVCSGVQTADLSAIAALQQFCL